MLVFLNVALEGKPAHIIRTESLTGHRQQRHDMITSGKQDDGNLWYAVALPLLRFLVIVAWDEVLVERKASVIILEQYEVKIVDLTGYNSLL